MTEKNRDDTAYAVSYAKLLNLAHMDKRGNNGLGLHSNNLFDYSEFNSCLELEIPIGALVTTKEHFVKVIDRHIGDKVTAENIWDELCGRVEDDDE